MYLNSTIIGFLNPNSFPEPQHRMYLNDADMKLEAEVLVPEPQHRMYLNLSTPILLIAFLNLNLNIGCI